MLSAVTGTYRNGSVELSEKPTGVEEGAEVIVTFLSPKSAKTSNPPVSLRGAWAGKIAEDTDWDGLLQEARKEWEQEWEDADLA